MTLCLHPTYGEKQPFRHCHLWYRNAPCVRSREGTVSHYGLFNMYELHINTKKKHHLLTNRNKQQTKKRGKTETRNRQTTRSVPSLGLRSASFSLKLIIEEMRVVSKDAATQKQQPAVSSLNLKHEFPLKPCFAWVCVGDLENKMQSPCCQQAASQSEELMSEANLPQYSEWSSFLQVWVSALHGCVWLFNFSSSDNKWFWYQEEIYAVLVAGRKSQGRQVFSDDSAV